MAWEVRCSSCSYFWGLILILEKLGKQKWCEKERNVSTSDEKTLCPHQLHKLSAPRSLGLLSIYFNIDWILAGWLYWAYPVLLLSPPWLSPMIETLAEKSRERHLTLRSLIHRLIICPWHGLAASVEIVVRWDKALDPKSHTDPSTRVIMLDFVQKQ